MSTSSPSGSPPTAPAAGAYWDIMGLRPQFGKAPLLRIDPEWREGSPPVGPAAELFARHLTGQRSVLDVGAGDRYWKGVLERLGFDGEYCSADTETRHPHEFTDFLSIERSFDVVLFLELLEHLPGDVGTRFLEHARQLLPPGGVLVIGTPNPRHAHQVWSADFTHVRPWPAHDLWATCLTLGFNDVEVYRQMLVPPRRRAVLPIQLLLSKLLELDPAHGLLIFARV